MAETVVAWKSADYNISLYEPGIKEEVPPLLCTYHHIPVILLVYVVTVTYYGPMLMRDRKPYDLKILRMFYNMVQIAMNLYINLLCFDLIGKNLLDPWRSGCYPVTNASRNPDVFKQIVKIGYYYYLNKLFDCIETVFFVLRKKQSQVSFLHLYHHVIMVYSIWLSIFHFRGEKSVVFRGTIPVSYILRFSVIASGNVVLPYHEMDFGLMLVSIAAPIFIASLSEENLVQIAALNSLIHIIMYIYYFLSGLGPGMQKYLWWKKYITRLQMIQFLMGMTTLLKMAVSGCYNDGRFVVMWYINSISLLALFLHFYIKTYRSKTK